MKDIITITGDIGSGKSTVASGLGKLLGYSVVTTGSIQRDIAARRGLTPLQLNEIAMKDKAVDQTIDGYLQEIDRRGDGRLILDSRLAWHFVRNAFDVFLAVDPHVGAQRVLSHNRPEEVHRDVADAMRNNLRRRELEITRFAGLYGIRCDDLGSYDLVVDSSWTSPEAAAQVIMNEYSRPRTDDSGIKAYLCPKSLYPTEGVKRLDTPEARDIAGSMRANGYDIQFPIEVVRFGHYFFIYDGHIRASCALRMGMMHVPCHIHAADDETQSKGLRYKDEVLSSLDRPWIHDWENAHKMKYASYPDTTGSPRIA